MGTRKQGSGKVKAAAVILTILPIECRLVYKMWVLPYMPDKPIQLKSVLFHSGECVFIQLISTMINKWYFLRVCMLRRLFDARFLHQIMMQECTYDYNE